MQFMYGALCACRAHPLLEKYFEIKSSDPTDVRADVHGQRMFFVLRGYVLIQLENNY